MQDFSLLTFQVHLKMKFSSSGQALTSQTLPHDCYHRRCYPRPDGECVSGIRFTDEPDHPPILLCLYPATHPDRVIPSPMQDMWVSLDHGL